MEEDEVVNCRCHHPEGDGMMVQVIEREMINSVKSLKERRCNGQDDYVIL